mmetsp:Transcript_93836/g.223127  ORF Transcript_93836/g.223127 Transcript_93836/m.223127 type:complete len:206 (+) Transcript_93836:325-942(+)
MAKTKEMATTVFCPPDSWFMVRKDVCWPVKDTSMRTPTVPSSSPILAGVSSDSMILSRALIMRSLPTPPWTKCAKTSRKWRSTFSSVCRTVSSFCASTEAMNLSTASRDSSMMAFFRWSSWSWSVKVVYWSMAFLFTCSYLLRPLLVFSSCFISCWGVISLYLPMSVDTTVSPRSFSSASPLRFTRLVTFMAMSSRVPVKLFRIV